MKYIIRHFGRGYGHGFDRGWHFCWPTAFRSPEGFKYLGPCRCGFGPHAYWQDERTGRIYCGFPGYGTAVSPGYSWSAESLTSEEIKSEIEWLKQEKEALEKRIRDLEERLKQTDKEPQK